MCSSALSPGTQEHPPAEPVIPRSAYTAWDTSKNGVTGK
jgi:hypothetical protein